MFGLFPTNKSDCNLRIPDPLWPYKKNTKHPELLTALGGLLHLTRDMISYHSYQSESKTKPSGCKTQSDFVKR